jgi:hypothetical protein
MTRSEERLLTDRIDWLKQKLEAQRNPDSPEYNPRPICVGRTEGNIGALEWALRELRKLEGVRDYQ